MNATELRTILNELGLSQLEAARLLGIRSRTVQRWAAGYPFVTESAAQALCAWRRLAESGLSGRPDSIDICIEEFVSPARHRKLEERLALIIDDVGARGGPTMHWHVNLNRRRAVTNEIVVYFNRVANGLFAPASYRRHDREASKEQDWPLIEEAIAAFAKSVRVAATQWLGADSALRGSSRTVTVFDGADGKASL